MFDAHSQVEAGDVILKVNGTDVHRYSTKEGKFLILLMISGHELIFGLIWVAVLRCLRLSSDPVTLELKRGEIVIVFR